jgi:hypothetical protein
MVKSSPFSAGYAASSCLDDVSYLSQVVSYMPPLVAIFPGALSGKRHSPFRVVAITVNDSTNSTAGFTAMF